jgi:hypothetical protein
LVYVDSFSAINWFENADFLLAAFSSYEALFFLSNSALARAIGLTSL